MPCDRLVKKPTVAEPRFKSTRAVSGRGSESVGLKFILGRQLSRSTTRREPPRSLRRGVENQMLENRRRLATGGWGRGGAGADQRRRL